MVLPIRTGASSIVDAHHHFWDPVRNYHPWLRDEPMIPFRYGDYSALRLRRYLAEEYLRDASNHRVEASVYVETEWDPSDPIGEMEYVATLRKGGLPSVAVGQAWLDRHDVGQVLERLTEFIFVRSVRHKPKPGDMLPGSTWREGFALLARRLGRFDLQAPWALLGEAASLARDFPSVQIVLNHTGLPADRSPEGIAGWHAAMRGLARHRNVAVKISGLGQPGTPWTAEANRGIVFATIDLFGVERCMFASNFPVDGLVATFDQIYRGFAEIVRGFSADERAALFATNARRIYDIQS